MGCGPVVSCVWWAAFTVGRGPVPRHARGYPAIARDRPSRYGMGGVSRARDRKPRFHRRAGACPPPCSGLSKTFARAVFVYCTLARDRPSRYGMGSGSLSLNDREGQALALRLKKRLWSKTPHLPRRAGACPPPCSGLSKTFARTVFVY